MECLPTAQSQITPQPLALQERFLPGRQRTIILTQIQVQRVKQSPLPHLQYLKTTKELSPLLEHQPLQLIQKICILITEENQANLALLKSQASPVLPNSQLSRVPLSNQKKAKALPKALLRRMCFLTTGVKKIKPFFSIWLIQIKNLLICN